MFGVGFVGRLGVANGGGGSIPALELVDQNNIPVTDQLGNLLLGV